MGKFITRPMSQSIKIAHISDLHFTNEQSFLRGFFDNQKLFTKRHLGWINYNLKRRSEYNSFYKERLLNSLMVEDWDYVAITGDLTTLSLKKEFERALRFVTKLSEKGTVLLTAGNHDRYVKKHKGLDYIQKKFEIFWPNIYCPNKAFDNSILKLSESVVITELDMAIARPIYSSRGKINCDLNKIGRYVKKHCKNKVKIAIGHYPAFLPPNEHEGRMHSLENKRELQEFLVSHDFDLYLHGHIHKNWIYKPEKKKPLICVNSGGSARDDGNERGSYHTIEIKDRNIDVKLTHF